MTTGHEVDSDGIVTLPYASAPLSSTGCLSIPLQFITFLLTCGSLLLAWQYIDTYVRNIGNWCGTPIAGAEGLLILGAAFATFESVVAFIMAKTRQLLAEASRPVLL